MTLMASLETNVAAVQRRTLRLLFLTQIISGVGIAVGASVGALLAADIAGVRVSGLAQSALVVGAALFAVPATAIVNRHGRRPSLAAGYLVAAAGSTIVVLAAMRDSIPLLFAGFFLFGGASAASLQARYAAVDLAPAQVRGRHLSWIVWATTLGAVVGPSLAPLAGTSLDGYGVPTLAGPYLLSAVLLGFAALLLVLFLRPDPAVVARGGTGSPGAPGSETRRAGMRAALPVVASHAPARLGAIAMAVGHLVMVGVMAMTPVHIRSAGHDAVHTLGVVGTVLSVHIAGMYAFSPLVGWLADRLGRRAVIFAGFAILLVACAVTGSAGHASMRLAAGLMLLGLGWSATMVAGSTLVSESVPLELRASAQGLSDLTMGIAGASAGAVSGVIMDLWGYAALAVLAAVLIVLASASVIASGPGRVPSSA